MAGLRSIDQMVETAIELIAENDRGSAEELLAQVLRIEPEHEKARQTMKLLGAHTSPGGEKPLEPIEGPTVVKDRRIAPPPNIALSDEDDVVTPFYTKLAESPPGSTPLEPQPAFQPGPPGLARRNTLPGQGDLPVSRTGDETIPGRPAIAEMPEAGTDRHLSLVPEVGNTEPQLEPVVESSRAWTLSVLTGPHAGTTLPVTRRQLMIGKGLGALDVEDDPFISPAHASFFVRNDELWVSDGSSTSGTWLSITQPEWVSAGGSFSAGLQRFRFLGLLEGSSAPQDPMPYGSPRPAASWRLEHVLLGNRPSAVWVVRGSVPLGRAGHIAFPDDETLDAVHAELRPARTSLEIIDRSEGGGVFVMLPPGSERRVPAGARVRLGAMIFQASVR